MKQSIASYIAKETREGVVISRCYAGITEDYKATTFEEVVDFLIEQFPYSIHICWSLYPFGDAIFSLLPRATQRELGKKSKVFIGDTKVFNTERILGITTTRQITGNICSRAENNFYGVSRWFSPQETLPTEALEVERLGYDLLDGLEKLGLYPDKLTSPIGLFMEQIDTELLPTIFNTPDSLLDAMSYASQMARYEWRKKFSRKKEGYHFDLTSAYPFFIAGLPDTRHGTMSRKRGNHQWGIAKGKFTVAKLGVLPIDKNAKYFTTEEIDWVESHNLGTFEIEDGYYFNFNGGKPYKTIVDRLLGARRTDDTMVAYLAKRIAQGLSGKLDQYNKDGTMGELYNPILASMVRSRCRLAVADFIYDNGLQDSLIEVRVDGVTAGKKLDLPSVSKPGEWRIVTA